LKDEPQSSPSISSSVQNIDIIKSPRITREKVLVEKTLFSFIWLDIMIAQMLDIAVLLVFFIPFKLIPMGPVIERS